jgi:hypothetical protein
VETETSAPTPTPTFAPIYKDARTGFFKVAHFARSRDRYWGSLKFVGQDWTLIRKNSDGTQTEIRTGVTSGYGGAQIQRTLDVINGPQATASGSRKRA